MRAFVFAVVLMAACATPRILTPPTGPSTNYPCGINGVECGDHTCCYEDEICGGGPFNGCPAHACCPAQWSPVPDGAKWPHRERKRS
jgi:hypothetical protein